MVNKAAHHITAQHNTLAGLRVWLRMACNRPTTRGSSTTNRQAGWNAGPQSSKPGHRHGRRSGSNDKEQQAAWSRYTASLLAPQAGPLPLSSRTPVPGGCTRAGGASLGMGYPEDWARLRQDADSDGAKKYLLTVPGELMGKSRLCICFVLFWLTNGGTVLQKRR